MKYVFTFLIIIASFFLGANFYRGYVFLKLSEICEESHKKLRNDIKHGMTTFDYHKGCYDSMVQISKALGTVFDEEDEQ